MKRRAPWAATTPGTALQLVDPAQDNSRVANWAIGGGTGYPAQTIPLLAYTNAWKFMSVSNLDGVNWTATAFNDTAWPSGRGLLAYENNPAITPLTNTWLNAPTAATNNAAERARLLLPNQGGRHEQPRRVHRQRERLPGRRRGVLCEWLRSQTGSNCTTGSWSQT